MYPSARMRRSAVARGGLETVVAVPEVDLVDVHREDLIFGIPAFDLERHERFVDLPRDGLARGEENPSRELLGQRRASLSVSLVLDVRENRRDRAGQVHASMPIEVLVLGRDDRVFQDHGYVRAGDQDATLDRVARDRGAVGAPDL